MGRSSTRENKNIYQKTRESLKLTRESASELLETMSPERIEKIESEKSLPRPDEVLLMANKYKMPTLTNYYCSKQCEIGRQYVPEVEVPELSSIVLSMLASLNNVGKMKDRLIEIAADGVIDQYEISDFVKIQDELERISLMVESLQYWVEEMIQKGKLDKETYQKLLQAKKTK